MAALHVHRSALVERPAEMMFDLIEAAEHYPDFLPWCAGATILERSDEIVAADLRVNWHGLKLEFSTRNPKRRPRHMAIHLVRGPFRRFEGQWHLKPLSPVASKIDFELDDEFDASIAARLAGPVFARIADTRVDAFVWRALSLPLTAPPAAPPAAASASAPGAPG
jgi:ribosome-associated toxin RatA of RatAB toxin-antitoxin module